MNIEQEIRDQIENIKKLKQEVGYINNHLSILEGFCRKDKDEAYKKGINDGSLDVKQRVEGAYQRGLEDAWEAAKKIFGYEIDGALAIDELREAFGYKKEDLFCTADIIRANTAEQAIEKLKAYEEHKDDNIKVGDCVYDKEERPRDDGVVTWVGKDTAYVMWKDGSSGIRRKELLCKTGRTLNVKALLEAMRT